MLRGPASDSALHPFADQKGLLFARPSSSFFSHGLSSRGTTVSFPCQVFEEETAAHHRKVAASGVGAQVR